MQLLNSLHTQLSEIPESLQTTLYDIVHKLEIESQYSIKHPDYPTLELQASVTSRFQKLSPALQNKYLSLQLRSLIYSLYYNGAMKTTQLPNAETPNLALNQNLENNTYLGVDLAFYDRLHENNRGKGYWSYGWQVVKRETDGTLAVQRDGLTLHVEQSEDILLSTSGGKLIAIKLPKNLVQNGFYMAVADAGVSQQRQKLVRVYFNLVPEGAVAIMDSLTTHLNAIPIAFTFKALYNPSEYGRYDSAVLYFEKNDYEKLHPVLELVYAQNRSHFQEQVPLFTRSIAPGLAIAEEPDHKFNEQESFGTHRCQIVADGLIDAWQQGNNTPDARLASIVHHFSLHKITLQRPYLNANSEDIYTSLNW